MKALQISLAVLVVIAMGIGIFILLSLRTNPASTAPVSTGTEPSTQNTVTSGATQPAAAFAIAFYTWYLQGLSQNIHFSSTQFASSSSQWLTSDFAGRFAAIGSNTEQDPVLLAQDYLPSWLSNINAAVTSQSSSGSEVLVSLGTGAELQKLQVNVVPFGNEWRIAAVSKAN